MKATIELIIHLIDQITTEYLKQYGFVKSSSKDRNVKSSDNTFTLTFLHPKKLENKNAYFIQKSIYINGKRLVSEINVEEKSTYIKIRYHVPTAMYYFTSPYSRERGFIRFQELIVINKTNEEEFIETLKAFLYNIIKYEIEYLIYVKLSADDQIQMKTKDSYLNESEQIKTKEEKRYHHLFYPSKNLLIRFCPSFKYAKVKSVKTQKTSKWLKVKKINDKYYIPYNNNKLWLHKTIFFVTPELYAIERKFNLKADKLLNEITSTPYMNAQGSERLEPLGYVYHMPLLLRRKLQSVQKKHLEKFKKASAPYTIPIEMGPDGWPPKGMEKNYPAGLHGKDWEKQYVLNEFYDIYRLGHNLANHPKIQDIADAYLVYTAYSHNQPVSVIKLNEDYYCFKKEGDNCYVINSITNSFSTQGNVSYVAQKLYEYIKYNKNDFSVVKNKKYFYDAQNNKYILNEAWLNRKIKIERNPYYVDLTPIEKLKKEKRLTETSEKQIKDTFIKIPKPESSAYYIVKKSDFVKQPVYIYDYNTKSFVYSASWFQRTNKNTT